MRRLLGLGLLLTSLALLLGGVRHPAAVHAAATPVADQGTVVDGSGKPVAGAVVALYFSPTSGTVSAADSMTTDSSGNYTVSADPSAAMLAAAQANGGYVPFELEVTSSALTSTTFFSREWTGSGWATGDAAPPPTTPALAKGAAGVRQTPRSVWHWTVAHKVGVAPNDAGAPCPVTTHVLGSAQKDTIVGEVHTATDATETYSYGKTADSDIQVGVSVNDVDWSVSGSVHVSNSKSGKSVWHVGAGVGHKVTTQMEYNHDKEIFSCTGATKDFLVKTTAWNGGAANGDNNHDLDGHCPAVGDGNHTQKFVQNTENISSTEDQVQFSTAVTVFGVGLNAKSGWGTNVVSHWVFGSQPTHYLCGNDGTVQNAHRVFAGLQQ